MKVGTQSWGIRQLQQSYQQIKPQKVNEHPPAAKREVNTAAQRKDIVRPRDILTAKEIATLQALFDNSANRTTFYGKSRVANINSGYLLDIKG